MWALGKDEDQDQIGLSPTPRNNKPTRRVQRCKTPRHQATSRILLVISSLEPERVSAAPPSSEARVPSRWRREKRERHHRAVRRELPLLVEVYNLACHESTIGCSLVSANRRLIKTFFLVFFGLARVHCAVPLALAPEFPLQDSVPSCLSLFTKAGC